MFADPNLRASLDRLYSSETDRFDQLVVAAGLNPKTDLVGADLRGVDFFGSILDGWDLSHSDLTGASFRGAKIRDLKIEEAIGADLSGAESFEQTPDAIDESLDWLTKKISEGAKGADRWPYLQRLFARYRKDERAWEFLINKHLTRERVGKYVVAIIREWENASSQPRKTVDDLLVRLLGQGGSPYITVRARLLKELAARRGSDEKVFEIARNLIEREGYWTSGIVAISVLANVFKGSAVADAILREALTTTAWSVSKADVAAALLKGFDSVENRALIERQIFNTEVGDYERSRMLRIYLQTDDARSREFASRVFDSGEEGILRSVTLEAVCGRTLMSRDEAEAFLSEIAFNDRHPEVRSAAFRILSKRNIGDARVLLNRAMSDVEPQVRAAAVSLMAELGLENWQWFAHSFGSDSSDMVRGVSLNGLLEHIGAENRDHFRDLLVTEVGRIDPSFSAVRSAHVLLHRWPTNEHFRIVKMMLEKLPAEISGWHSHLTRLVKDKEISTGG